MRLNLICAVFFHLVNAEAAGKPSEPPETPRPRFFVKSDVEYILIRRNASVWFNEPYVPELDKNKAIKVIIHGFFQSPSERWVWRMAAELVKKSDCYVVLVDWSAWSFYTYGISALYSRLIGVTVGNFLYTLCQKYGNILPNVHVIGYSLGAHVAGVAARTVRQKTGYRVARITGLEPAGPLFEGLGHVMEGLTPLDAEVVDVIHTDAGLTGRQQPCGTVDFYPNGGVRHQPGCEAETHFSLDIVEMFLCSHFKAYRLYTESINNKNYVGYRCDSWELFQAGKCRDNPVAIMGDNYVATSLNVTGKVYLTTE